MYPPYASDVPTGVLCIGTLIVLTIDLIIVYYLYTRAEEYGQSGCLWALLGLFFPIPVVVIFLLINMNAGSRGRGRRGDDCYTRGGVYGGQQGGAMQQAPKHAAPDPFFRDDHLESLIEQGQLSEARKYMREMIDMARGMHDEAGLRNYAQYEPKINKAAMDSTRRRGGYS